SLLASRTYEISRPLASKLSGGKSLRTLRAVRVRAERKGIRRAARQTTASSTFRWRPATPVQAAPLRERTQCLVAHPSFTVRSPQTDFSIWNGWGFEPKPQQTAFLLLRRLRRRGGTPPPPQQPRQGVVQGISPQAGRVHPPPAYQCYQW